MFYKSTDVDCYNNIVVPIFEFDNKGNIKPNPLFHRSFDKLHSRCIEYPFAASNLGNVKCILDVGISKSDTSWIKWLESLPIDVYAVDYDVPEFPYNKIKFYQSDVRNLPFDNHTFDKVMAISVIEHIGLAYPQVRSRNIPNIDNNGDIEAVRELARVLKKGGELIMTLPFGIRDEIILGNDARNYTVASIKKFEQILDPIVLEYYEYQNIYTGGIYKEYRSFSALSLMHIVKSRLLAFIKNIYTKMTIGTPTALYDKNHSEKMLKEKEKKVESLSGPICWVKMPINEAKAIHKGHVEGVVCGVWKKR